jgi:hypothetical protein
MPHDTPVGEALHASFAKHGRELNEVLKEVTSQGHVVSIYEVTEYYYRHWKVRHPKDTPTFAHKSVKPIPFYSLHLSLQHSEAHIKWCEGGQLWKTEGHKYIGQRVIRHFQEVKVQGVVTAWLPPMADVAHFGEAALWHVVHDDGDEEDMWEAGLKEAIKKFRDENDVVASAEDREREEGLAKEKAEREAKAARELEEKRYLEEEDGKRRHSFRNCRRKVVDYKQSVSAWRSADLCSLGLLD